MTDSQKIERLEAELVAAIVKAVPEIVEGLHCLNNVHAEFLPSRGKKKVARPITLEDVLRALRQTEDGRSIAVTAGGVFIEFTFTEDTGGTYQELGDEKGRIVQWQLGLPLSQQSDECKAFLHSLLCHE